MLRWQRGQHHVAEDRGRAVQVLAQDQVERRADAKLRATRDPRGHRRRDVLEDARADRGRADFGAAHRLGHRVEVAGVQRAHRADRHFLGLLVRHQPDGVAAALIQRVQQGPVHIHEGDFVARFAEQLPHEPAADVPGAEDDRLFHE